MNRRVLIIGSSETFIVKGIEMKLGEMGVEAIFAETRIKTVKENLENVEDVGLIIFYMDETVKEISDVVVFLNDICTEKEMRIIAIGAKMEYEALKPHLHNKILIKWFERPLNMHAFLETVDVFFQLAAIEAKKKSILIVDDDVAYMRVIASWFDGIYRVGMANSGIQAITWLAKNHADLILLDYDMPVTSGPQVMEMLRTEAQTSSIPVMFLTGKRDRESIVNVLRLRPADYLVKTIEKKTLLRKLEKFFQNADAEDK